MLKAELEYYKFEKTSVMVSRGNPARKAHVRGKIRVFLKDGCLVSESSDGSNETLPCDSSACLSGMSTQKAVTENGEHGLSDDVLDSVPDMKRHRAYLLSETVRTTYKNILGADVIKDNVYHNLVFTRPNGKTLKNVVFNRFDTKTKRKIQKICSQIEHTCAQPGSIDEVTGQHLLLDHECAASLIHEIFGHRLEKNMHESLETLMRDEKNLPVKVEDDPTVTGLAGSFSHDDQGHAGKRKVLLDSNGIHNYLCDNFTSSDDGAHRPGNARMSTLALPFARMSNLILRKGKDDIEDYRKQEFTGLVLSGIKKACLSKNRLLLYPMTVKKVMKGFEHTTFDRLCFVMTVNELMASLGGVGNKMEYDNLGMCSKGVHRGLPVGYGCPELFFEKPAYRIFKMKESS